MRGGLQSADPQCAGQEDGIIEVWFDGKKVYSDHARRLRIGEQGRIDSFYFSTFHAGNSADWAPSVNSAARFDDIRITREPPDFAIPAG
jgi:hypothetical protein